MGKTVTTGYINDTIHGIKVKSGIKCNAGNLSRNAGRKVVYVVMHYTGNASDTANANAKYFSEAGRNASAHFFVDDKEIYQSVKLRDTAWHCGAKKYYHTSCRNSNSIGIEMCCTAGNYKISDKTKENAACLCAYLCKKLGISAGEVDKYVLRHYDVTHKNCPAQMSGNKKEWTDFKEHVRKILGSTKKAAESVTQTATGTNQNEYLIKITKKTTKVRKGPGKKYPVTAQVHAGEVYTIVKEGTNNGIKWGELKSGAGYVRLSHAKRV